MHYFNYLHEKKMFYLSPKTFWTDGLFDLKYDTPDGIYITISVQKKKMNLVDDEIYIISFSYQLPKNNNELRNSAKILEYFNENTQEIIRKNSFTDELVNYLMMDDNELEKFSGFSKAFDYRKRLISTISLFYD